jgi:hypothetical protein
MMAPMIDLPSVQDVNAWHILSPLLVQGGYLPWTTGSMRPAGLVAICNEIVHGSRERTIECGSGVSTVLIARLLRERDAGGLVSLEHDAHWAEVVDDQLRRESLDPIARVVHAPLDGTPPWYGGGELADVPDTVDLLIVDGPPAFDPGHGARRAPALPWFNDRLVRGATVMLDDIDRPGERDVIALWEASTEWRFSIDEPARIAIGRRPDES